MKKKKKNLKNLSQKRSKNLSKQNRERSAEKIRGFFLVLKHKEANNEFEMEVQKNVSLKPYNTFGIDVEAEYFVHITTVESLQDILKNPDFKDIPKHILGGGSNILLTKPVEGLVLLLDLKGKKIREKNDQYAIVESAAGENWHEFVLWTLDQNLGGLENLSLIPGNVGTSPMQNIGAYGVEIKDTFYDLEAIEIETGKIRRFFKSDCQFGYRESVFKHEYRGKYIITKVSFELSKYPTINTSYGAIQSELENLNIEHPTIQDVSKAVISIRQRKLPDPVKIGNSGSFFKNPTIPTKTFLKLQQEYPNIVGYQIDEMQTKVAAGWLIDQAGWKGYRDGDAGVHEHQALVLVNHGNATGTEILSLAQKIQNSVQEKFGIEIFPEVNIW